MKKILSIVCALSLAMLCMTALAVEPADLIGTWKLTTIEMDSSMVNATDAGVEMGVVINEDGTASITMDGKESDPVIWKLDGDVLSLYQPSDEGEPLVATYEDGKLIIVEEDMNWIFEKVTLPTEAADFIGTWSLITMEMGSSIINAADAEIEMGAEINEDGTASLTLDGEEAESTIWKLDGDTLSLYQPSGEGEPLVMTYKDGKLIIVQEEVNLILEKVAS